MKSAPVLDDGFPLLLAHFVNSWVPVNRVILEMGGRDFFNDAPGLSPKAMPCPGHDSLDVARAHVANAPIDLQKHFAV